MPTVARKLLALIWAAILGFAIALIPQAVWSALILLNLNDGDAMPWAVALMAVLLWLYWSYLGGHGPPRSSADARRNSLRARLPPRSSFATAIVAGALAIVALDGLWSVMAQLVRMPGSVLPDLSGYPLFTGVALVAMGSLVSPICEQAGLWGYCQTRLERELPAWAAIVLTAALFALLPHPPARAAIGARLLFFFLTGLTFSVLAYLTGSIVPGLLVHIGGIASFFTLVWPNDPARALVLQSGVDAWFVIHAAQTVICAGLAVVALRRLARITSLT